MPRIARHTVDLEWVRKRLPKKAALIPTYLAAIPNDMTLTNAFQGIVEDYAGYFCVEHTDSPEICRAFRLGAHAMAALFRAATATEEEIEVSLGEGPPVRVRARVDESIVNVGNWLQGYFMAAVSREAKLLDSLCAVEPALLRRSSTTALEYHHLFLQALRAFWRRDNEAPALLLAALAATAPEQLTGASEEYVLSIIVPQMELLYRVMLQDAEGFNKALAKGLDAFTKYWRQGDRRDNPQGYLALGMLAIASFAHEAGMPIEIESDYLPTWLVRGDCHP